MVAVPAVIVFFVFAVAVIVAFGDEGCGQQRTKPTQANEETPPIHI
jgi:hypothetical protein